MNTVKKQLFLIRGLPGSGKSTIAGRLENSFSTFGYIHYEADHYFVDDRGVYEFDPTKLHRAHQWCLEQTEAALREHGVAIVSNTFTTIRELRPYFDLAAAYGIVPTVLLAQNNWGNIHDVPEESLERMRQRFVYDLSPLFNNLKGIE